MCYGKTTLRVSRVPAVQPATSPRSLGHAGAWGCSPGTGLLPWAAEHDASAPVLWAGFVCRLCGYPKKNIGWGKKGNKFKMTGTKLYQKSWAHISSDDFSVCVLFLSLQLLFFFFFWWNAPTRARTHTKGYFYCSCFKGLVVKYCFWNEKQQNEKATVLLLL